MSPCLSFDHRTKTVEAFEDPSVTKKNLSHRCSPFSKCPNLSVMKGRKRKKEEGLLSQNCTLGWIS